MKIAILSDLHFGYRRFYEDAFSQAAEAMQLACKMGDVVLVPGDLFDSRSPTPHAIKMALKIFFIPQGIQEPVFLMHHRDQIQAAFRDPQTLEARMFRFMHDFRRRQQALAWDAAAV